MASSSNSSNNNANNLVQNDGTFPELMVIQAFHIFTIKSLSQAKLEGLLDEDILASAEADVMICGPALCLFFAALRSNTTPPSVPIPTSATGTSAPVSLSASTCPPIFQSFFRLWAQAVPAIQALPSDAQHDLARIICDKPPLSSSSSSNNGESSASAPVHLNRIAADLRAVAIEITQRRTFQERYALDLQSALDAGQPAPSPGSEKRRVALFAPPPSYDETLSQGSNHSPHSSVHSSPQRPPASIPTTPSRFNAALPATPNVPVNTEGMQSLDGAVAQQPQSSSHLTVGQSSSSPVGASSSRHRSRPSSPTFLPPDAPAINLIRETLYAALGEVIATTPSILPILQSDPPRAYFSTVSLAILTVSTDCITPTGGVLTPLGRELTLAECPAAYRPLMHELGGIGEQARKIREEDDERAMYLARSGSTEAFEPRMERLRAMLEKGVAIEEERYDAAIVSASAASTTQTSTPMPAPTLPQRNPNPPAPPMPVHIIPGNTTITERATSPPRDSAPRFTTPAEDQQLLNPSTLIPGNNGSGSNSAASSPRSSGEYTRGIRNLLHKPKPVGTSSNNADSKPPSQPTPSSPPPIAPKPAPPSPGRYAPPSTPPPSMPVPANGAGPNMAGVGAGLISAMNGIGNIGSTSPPRAAMMAHQASLSTTGSPYDQALGSGARIAGTDSGVHLPATATGQHGHTQAVPAPAPAPTPAPAVPVPTETSNPRRSLEGSTVQFANRINALALNMTRLRMFQERQDMVFKILASVHD